MMKAVQLIHLRQPLVSRDIPVPQIGPADLLVRVKAAGICHSDAHYRAGRSPVRRLPLTLGHEVAGIVEQAGLHVSELKPGARVCLHYLATCGGCSKCRNGHEQFCRSAEMIGKHRDGGYAEYIVVPAASALPLPQEISFETGAIMMCSSATALHAFNKARIAPGQTVAIFGVGGLGVSAIQLGKILGAGKIFAVDINRSKLELAGKFGAIPIDASRADPVREILRLTEGEGVDVALELIGLPLTMQQAVRSLGVFGRAALVGITDMPFAVDAYHEIINKEAEIIGVSDHVAAELRQLLGWARQGRLTLENVITRRLPLSADAINQALDQLENFSDPVRQVIVP